jgi:hypothetical protein
MRVDLLIACPFLAALQADASRAIESSAAKGGIRYQLEQRVELRLASWVYSINGQEPPASTWKVEPNLEIELRRSLTVEDGPNPGSCCDETRFPTLRSIVEEVWDVEVETGEAPERIKATGMLGRLRGAKLELSGSASERRWHVVEVPHRATDTELAAVAAFDFDLGWSDGLPECRDGGRPSRVDVGIGALVPLLDAPLLACGNEGRDALRFRGFHVELPPVEELIARSVGGALRACGRRSGPDDPGSLRVRISGDLESEPSTETTRQVGGIFGGEGEHTVSKRFQGRFDGDLVRSGTSTLLRELRVEASFRCDVEELEPWSPEVYPTYSIASSWEGVVVTEWRRVP